MERMEAKANQLSNVQRRSSPTGETDDREAEEGIKSHQKVPWWRRKWQQPFFWSHRDHTLKTLPYWDAVERKAGKDFSKWRTYKLYILCTKQLFALRLLTRPGQIFDSNNLYLTKRMLTISFPVLILSSVGINNGF